MTKLLYITNQICGSGGLERVLSIKASYLADKMGYEVHFITLNQGDKPLFYEFSDKMHHHDVIATGKGLTFLRNYIKGMRKAVDIIAPDIISVCDDGLKGFWLPKILGKPCPMVYERHVSKNIEVKEDNANWRGRLKARTVFSLMHYAAKRYDRFVVLTKNNLSEWELSNLEVISNPISFFPPKTEISHLSNKKVLVVGRHSFQKGYDRLLHSWELVQKKHSDWKLEIYGKFDRDREYIKLAEKLGLQDTVTFYKPVKNIQDKYREASVYAMSSRFEGFGMVLIEAMAFGVPCVSYDCPFGPDEIIAHEENGLIVPNGDKEAFAAQIVRLIEDTVLRSELGIKARGRAADFLPENIVPKWDSLFQSLVKDGR